MAATPLPVASIDPDLLAQRLARSTNPGQLALAYDLRQLGALTRGAWRDRVEIPRVVPGKDGTIVIHTRLKGVNGLVRSGAQILPHDCWQALLVVPPSFAHAMPLWRFVGDWLPFAPHVLPRAATLNERDLPAPLLRFLEALRSREAGWTCVLDHWTPMRRTHNLSIFLWQCSRLICGASRFVGEEASLDPLARDHFIRLAEAGKLPLGPPLSYPGFADDTAAGTGSLDEEDIIDWLDDDA
jgi:hypothetical protein